MGLAMFIQFKSETAFTSKSYKVLKNIDTSNFTSQKCEVYSEAQGLFKCKHNATHTTCREALCLKNSTLDLI